MRPRILLRRVAFGRHIGRAFEHLAMRAKPYIESGQMKRGYNALPRDPQDADDRFLPLGGSEARSGQAHVASDKSVASRIE